MQRHREAIERWIEAINRRGEGDLLEAAMHPSIRVERYGFGATRGQLVQILEGLRSVAAWVAWAPHGVVFALEDEPEWLDDARGPTAVARYRFTVEDFSNGGEWRWRLADDGRLAWLDHRPDELPADADQNVPRTATPTRPNVIHAHPHPHPAGTDDVDGE